MPSSHFVLLMSHQTSRRAHRQSKHISEHRVTDCFWFFWSQQCACLNIDACLCCLVCTRGRTRRLRMSRWPRAGGTGLSLLGLSLQHGWTCLIVTSVEVDAVLVSFLSSTVLVEPSSDWLTRIFWGALASTRARRPLDPFGRLNKCCKKEGSLQRAARSYVATSGVGGVGFCPKDPSDISKDTCEEVVKIL